MHNCCCWDVDHAGILNNCWWIAFHWALKPQNFISFLQYFEMLWCWQKKNHKSCCRLEGSLRSLKTSSYRCEWYSKRFHMLLLYVPCQVSLCKEHTRACWTLVIHYIASPPVIDWIMNQLLMPRHILDQYMLSAILACAFLAVFYSCDRTENIVLMKIFGCIMVFFFEHFLGEPQLCGEWLHVSICLTFSCS